MAVLKYKKNLKPDNTWQIPYINIFPGFLIKFKNLSDITNLSETLKNLHLWGEVKEHWHDKRYLPMINKVQKDWDEKLKDYIPNINKELENFKNQIENYKKEYSVWLDKVIPDLKKNLEETNQEYVEKLNETTFYYEKEIEKNRDLLTTINANMNEHLATIKDNERHYDQELEEKKDKLKTAGSQLIKMKEKKADILYARYIKEFGV